MPRKPKDNYNKKSAHPRNKLDSHSERIMDERHPGWAERRKVSRTLDGLSNRSLVRKSETDRAVDRMGEGAKKHLRTGWDTEHLDYRHEERQTKKRNKRAATAKRTSLKGKNAARNFMKKKR